MKAPRVLTVGLSCWDHLWQVARFPPTASRTPVRAYRTQGGGPAATAAVTVARLGGQAELWAMHGDDVSGRAARAELEAYGVDCRGVLEFAGATSFVSAVLVAPGGERFIFPYYSPDLDDEVSRWDLGRVAAADCLLIDARHPRLATAAASEARRLGVRVVGDFSNTRHWELASLCDVLIVSEECAAEVLGRDEPEAALEVLRQRSDQRVGVTLGEQGFLYHDPAENETRHIPALAVTVVDTTGAGDVFHGAYAYAVARGWGAARAGLFASVTAALKCTALGGRAGIPSLDEVETLLLEKTAREMDEGRWV